MTIPQSTIMQSRAVWTAAAIACLLVCPAVVAAAPASDASDAGDAAAEDSFRTEVAPLLAQTIWNVFSDDSVSAIFAGENQLF